MPTCFEYLKKFSTEQLEEMLREECYGRRSLASPVLLDICEILALRDPSKPDIHDLVRQLCSYYL